MATKSQQNLYLILFSLIFYSLATPIGYGGIGVDASWQEALVMAIEKNEIFGRDFIFNYGSLGYFNTRLLPRTASPWLMVALDTFILINFLIIIQLVLRKAKKNWKVAALIGLLMLMPWGFIADASFTLFYFFLFWLFYGKEEKNTLALVVAAFISILIFYIKVNLSLIVYGIFYLSLVYFWWSKIITLRTSIITAVLQILLTFGLSFLLNVSILPYLGSSLKIINAYQDAMAEMILSKQEFLSLLFFEVLIIGVVLWYLIQNRKRFFHHSYLYFFGLITLACFLSFKQAHTAVAHYNVFGFFLFMPALGVLIYLFGGSKNRKAFLTSGRLVSIIFIISLVATQILRFYMGEHKPEGYLLTYPPGSVATQLDKSFKISKLSNIFFLKNPIAYFEKVINYNYLNNFKDKDIQQQRHLPESILNQIGNNSVDIMPSEISYIFFNRLNYVHRPIIQTYQANSAWLAEKNGEKYFSESAPEFVLFRVESFREQNPFWVDGNANLALLERYKQTGTAVVQEDTFLLMKKNLMNHDSLKTTQLAKKTFHLNEGIPINASENLLYFTADIQYNLLGKLARLVFQPPYLYCNVTYENGQEATFRVVNTILEGGILVNRKVTTQQEATQFFLKQGKANQRITNIRFWAKYQWGFTNEFEGDFKEVARQ